MRISYWVKGKQMRGLYCNSSGVKGRQWWEGWSKSGLEKHLDGKLGQLGDGLDVGSGRKHYPFKEEPHQNECSWALDLEEYCCVWK